MDCLPFRWRACGRHAIRLSLSMLLVLCVLPPGLRRATAQQGEADRYWAMLRDGTVVTGKQLREWHHEPGKPMLDDHALFEPQNPLRSLRDTWKRPQLQVPYLQLANGDVLTGTVETGLPAAPGDGLSDRVVVEVGTPLAVPGNPVGTQVSVLAPYIARAVLRGDGGGGVVPGKLIYADGREIAVNKIRWGATGIQALTDNDNLRVPYSELAEVHPPAAQTIDRGTAVLADNVAAGVDSESLVARLTTADGAELTYHRAMLRFTDTAFGSCHVVQPAWSLEPIAVPRDHVVSRVYRQRNEILLSLLRGETVAERHYLGGSGAWRLNRNMRGGELSVGELVSDSGLGTRSYSEIAFDLPPAARRFSTWLGIDRGVGIGGCAQCRVFRDQAAGRPIWQSGFLRGGDNPVRVEVGGLEGAQRLVLVTDFGHDRRPRGADPLDIRDEVSWLLPLVEIDVGALRPGSDMPSAETQIADLVPQLAGWQIDGIQRLKLSRYWQASRQRWLTAVVPTVEGDVKREETLFALKRRIEVTPANAWLEISAARDNQGNMAHEIEVQVNGQPVESVLNGNLVTGQGDIPDTRIWTLGPYLGQQIDLAVVVHPQAEGNHQYFGLLWRRLQLGPLVQGLAQSGQPIDPEFPLHGLETVDVKLAGDSHKVEAGKLSNGQPLVIRGYAFSEGMGLAVGEQVTYALDPDWGRFVAVIGLADGVHGAGPFEILLDDKLHWTSATEMPDGPNPGRFLRNTPARQIDIAIPPGHKTITLRLQGQESFGGWGLAGFLRRREK